MTASAASNHFTLPIRPFSSSSICQAKPKDDRARLRALRDPYLVAQRNQKKAANLSRRAELEKGRVASLGNPVRGVTTPFLESLDTARPVQFEQGKAPQDTTHLNYAFVPAVVQEQLEASRKLAVPLSELESKQATAGPIYPWDSGMNKTPSVTIQKTAEEISAQTEKDHARAVEAIARITALNNGSSKDRMRVNKNRCVEIFGRHNTDLIFPPRAPPLANLGETKHPIRPETNVAAAEKRVGKDTGSSEVQIAILTAKIRTVANFLETRGKGDKHNKRNLRVLVHKRQKLLQYLRRKERGGPRWQHCIETLGLTEGTWKGEISL